MTPFAPVCVTSLKTWSRRKAAFRVIRNPSVDLACPDQEETIRIRQPQSLRQLAGEDIELLAQDQVLSLEPGARVESTAQCVRQPSQPLNHRAAKYSIPPGLSLGSIFGNDRCLHYLISILNSRIGPLFLPTIGMAACWCRRKGLFASLSLARSATRAGRER